MRAFWWTVAALLPAVAVGPLAAQAAAERPTTVPLADVEVEHSVRVDHGAEVSGLTPLIVDLLRELWLRSSFRRHLRPEER